MSVFGFPRTINEKAARVVAGVVAVTAAVALAVHAEWLLIPLAYGFWARVLTGPTLSPLGRVASRVIAPRLGAPKTVSGPPKRFAQAVGAMLLIAATLESAFALCLGCRIFGLLMRAGLVPDEVCAECTDIWARRPA
jgi:hypothetical protein